MPLNAATNSSDQQQIPPPGRILPLVSDSIAHRAELAAIEFQEASIHAADSTLLAVVVGLFVLLGGFAVTLLVAVLVWESPYRAWWMGGLCCAYFAASGIMGWRLKLRLRTWRPFAATAAQVHLDHQCLTTLLKSFGR